MPPQGKGYATWVIVDNSMKMQKASRKGVKITKSGCAGLNKAVGAAAREIPPLVCTGRDLGALVRCAHGAYMHTTSRREAEPVNSCGHPKRTWRCRLGWLDLPAPGSWTGRRRDRMPRWPPRGMVGMPPLSVDLIGALRDAGLLTLHLLVVCLESALLAGPGPTCLDHG